MSAATGSEAVPPGHRAAPAAGTDSAGTDSAGTDTGTDTGGGSEVPRAALLRYALGSAGMGVYVTVPGLLLLYFLTDTLGVAPWLAGLALLVPKAVDIVLHPFVGSLSDRERARRGTRLRLLTAGCALAPAFVALFAVPGPVAERPWAAAAWVAGWFVVANALFAAYQVPYLSTPTDMTVGYHGRTRVLSFRMVVLTVGILVGGALAPLLAGEGDSVARYAVMALALGAFTVVFQAVGVGGVRALVPAGPPRDTPAPERTAPGRALGQVRDVLRANPSFRVLVSCYLLVSTTTHLVLAGLPYYARHELGRPGFTTVLMAAFVAPALLTTPLWFRLSRSWGKQRCLLVCQGLFVVGALGLAAGDAAGIAVPVLCTLLLGTCFAGLQLFPFAMVPDTVRAGGGAEIERTGAYTGVWTATEATGAAAGPYLYSAALGLGGYAAARAGEEVTQSGGAHTAILLGFTVLPALLMAAALAVQSRYRLDARLTRGGAAPTDGT
ncbi:MFS transporter [Streptomyces sp. NPDC014603]|jgi:GPH family glycoside/pentoside/hexuronide:cation symporter|uniref:MFS transporter n=1 Tax=unclassified Streptomyces TaxID=2593676 RepID=UPI00196223DE|nr:MFS transporter [Streptomyces sp. S12]